MFTSFNVEEETVKDIHILVDNKIFALNYSLLSLCSKYWFLQCLLYFQYYSLST